MNDAFPLGTGLGSIISQLDIADEIDWPPDYLAESAWLEHIPFAFWLMKALRPATFVELGTHLGVSYFSFCQTAQRLGIGTRCYAVDTWKGDPQAGMYGEEVLGAVSSLNNRLYRSFSSLLRMTFDEARERFAEGEVDLLHIDGYHTYDAAASDFRTWRDALSARAVVLLHDINVRWGDFGVWRLWNELRPQYPNFEFVHGFGLGILGVGNEFPDALRNLFATHATSDKSNSIRRIFAARGEAIRGQFLYQRAQADLQGAQADLQGAKADLAAAEARIDQLRAVEEEATRLRPLENEVARARDAADIAWRQRDRLERELVVASSALAEMRREAASLDWARQQLGHELTQLHTELAQLRTERHLVLTSTSWRITRPLRGAMRLALGEPAAWARVRAMLRPRGRHSRPSEPMRAVAPAKATALPRKWPAELLTERFPHIFALFPVFPAPDRERWVTILTDTISSNDLFGGVATAIILGVLLARRLDARLRVATRMEMLEPGNLDTLLKVQGITWDREVEFLQCSPSARPLAIGPDDIILTTSWWGTASALRTIETKRIFYLIQEDERRFYPHGDERLWCSELLNNSRLHFIVNTHMLHRYFAMEGITSIAERGIAFEPAFPEILYRRDPQPPGSRRAFLFYARPHHPRNLFYRGLEAICTAVEHGLLPPSLWDFHFVGRNVPEVHLPLNVTPTIHDTVPWAEYAALISRTDLGLSLMATPHPSYPPLDLAASGAVVVTNRDGPKTSLAQYSANILCVEPSVDGLVAALRVRPETS